MNEYHVVVTVEYQDGSEGELPFYNIPAEGRLDAIEKVVTAVRELYAAKQFDINEITVRPSPKHPEDTP